MKNIMLITIVITVVMGLSGCNNKKSHNSEQNISIENNSSNTNEHNVTDTNNSIVEDINNSIVEDINRTQIISIDKLCNPSNITDDYIPLQEGDTITKNENNTIVSIFQDQNNVRKVCLKYGKASIIRE